MEYLNLFLYFDVNISFFHRNFEVAFCRRTVYSKNIPKSINKEACSMSEDFGPNFISLTDEDGNEITLEYVDALELNGQTYMAFFPAVEEGSDEESEDYGLIILKSIMENGEELLSTLDDEEELNQVYDLFMEQFMEDEEK